MSLELVKPPKPTALALVTERLIAMGKREPLALIAIVFAALAIYRASGNEIKALDEAARLVLSQPMTVGTDGP